MAPLDLFRGRVGCPGADRLLLPSNPQNHPYLALALSLVFGGAVGNLTDRVRLGEVVDFLDFYLAPFVWHYPTFNVADSAVTVGIGIFIAHIVFKKMPF